MVEPAPHPVFPPKAVMADAAALHMRGASPQEVEDFCALGPDHRRAYEAADAVWRLSGVIGNDHPVFAAEKANVRLFRPSRRTVVAIGAALAACLVLALTPSVIMRLNADYFTDTGISRSVTLTDGTKVTLAPQTALAVDMQGATRQVRLLKGQAWFDVVKNPQQPFQVTARDVKVTVTGTQFDVATVGDKTSVALAEGRVHVGYAAGRADLLPGQALSVERHSHSVGVEEVPVSGIAAWRRGRLLVQDMRVGDIAARLQPYHAGVIVITDKTLSDRRVAGAFDLNDPRQALEIAVAPYGGRVYQVSPYLLIVSRK